jgi:outer membrane protein
MLNKKNITIATLLAVVILLSFSVLYLATYGKQKTGYIVIEQVFNSFQFKKEMQKKYEATKITSNKVIDSLQFELQMLAGKLDKTKDPKKEEVLSFEQKRDEFLKRKQRTTEDLQNLSDEYDKEILTQLNQYMKEYGNQNGYTYIFGNDSNGALMYAHDAENITDQVVSFINSKYQGTN